MFRQQEEPQTSILPLHLTLGEERNLCTGEFHMRQSERRLMLELQARCSERKFTLFWELGKED